MKTIIDKIKSAIIGSLITAAFWAFVLGVLGNPAMHKRPAPSSWGEFVAEFAAGWGIGTGGDVGGR